MSATPPADANANGNGETGKNAPPTTGELINWLWCLVDDKSFLCEKWFPSKENLLKEYGQRATVMYDHLMSRGCPRELAIEFLILLLYDVVILADDSFSMRAMEEGQRIDTLIEVIKHISEVYSWARPNGIVALKFFNATRGFRNITLKHVDKVFENRRYNGLTRIGTELKLKILNQFANLGDMRRPLLVMTITDGAIEGENPDLLRDVIADCVLKMNTDANKDPKTGTAGEAIGFQFSRIGNDEEADSLLQQLDDDERIGKYIDCMPAKFALENLRERDPEGQLSLRQWATLGKLMLGGILDTWDKRDKETWQIVDQTVDNGYDQLPAEQNDEEDNDDDFDFDQDDDFGATTSASNSSQNGSRNPPLSGPTNAQNGRRR